ncbi:DNA mismatch repair protein MSH1, mitochondrial [Capsicum chinense]|nr:DNA mismatch repair protein MSH1, mitochondrial [Capsicum chinense]
MQHTEALNGTVGMKIIGLSPYWFDAARGTGVQNTVDMQSLFLLTGPNGGGKSSLLRSLCAAALLGICGFMVPAESAVIPHFDSIMLHMKSYDSPADGKSSFQIEMSEIRSLITGATSSSLVLIDEICRGTETAKGTCIAGSVIETLDAIGCLGIVSTHLHGIFDLPLKIKRTVYKAMGAEYVDGQPIPTWKLIDGVCKESLAFETAQREGIPEILIQRAEELYNSAYGNQIPKKKGLMRPRCSDIGLNSTDKSSEQLNGTREIALDSSTKLMQQMGISSKKLEDAIRLICQKKLLELYKVKNPSEVATVNCVLIAAREQPAPSTIGASSVYIVVRPDKKFYVGQTDDLEGRVRAHRLKEGMENASFLYFLVPGKSIACQLETLLINQLPSYGFQLTNVADVSLRWFVCGFVDGPLYHTKSKEGLVVSNKDIESGIMDDTKSQEIESLKEENLRLRQVMEMYRAWASGLPPPPFPTFDPENALSLSPKLQSQFSSSYSQWHTPVPQHRPRPPRIYQGTSKSKSYPWPEFAKRRKEKDNFTPIGESYASLF